MMVAIDRRTCTSRRVRVRNGIMERPFRALAVVLALVALLMLHGIITTPTYEQERLAAEARYNAALAENRSLRRQLAEAIQPETEISAARDQYGYVYNGEVIYEPVFVSPDDVR